MSKHYAVTSRTLLGALLLAGAVVRCPTASGEAPLAEPERRRLESVAVEACERISAFLKEEGFPATLQAKSPLPVRTRERAAGPEWRGIEFGGTTSGVEVDFSAAARIRGFFNWAAIHNSFGKDARVYDGPSKPTWSEEKAKRVAQDSVAALLGKFPENVTFKKAAYEHSHEPAPNKFKVGEWRVVYNRVDKAGHAFQIDCVAVSVSEQYGPLSIGVNLQSEYIEPQGKLLSQEEAIGKSLPFAQRMADSPMGRGWFRSHALTGEKTAEMLIVNPNRFLSAKSDTEAFQRSRVARLAWEVKWEVAYVGPKQAAVAKPKGEIVVWIDAATGEYLGGDLK